MARSPKHFKVHCSLRNHRKTVDMAADNDLLATYVRLGILGIERFADRTGDTFLVSMAELPAVTGTKRSDSARKLLNKLATTSPVVVNYLGTSCKITIPNLAKKQGFGGFNGTGKGASSSSTPTPTSTKKEIGEAPSAPPAPRARRAKMRAPCPDALDDSEWTRVLAWAAKEGVPLADVVREWDAMRDYWRGKGELRADWSASFRTWLRNAKRFAERDRRDGGMSPAQAKAERTKEAGRQAYELIQQRKLGLIEGGAA